MKPANVSLKILALIILFITSSAHADLACENDQSWRYDDQCRTGVIEEMDLELKTRLAKLSKNLDSHRMELVNKSQKSWVEYMRSECESEGDLTRNMKSGRMEWGTMQSFDISWCKGRMIQRRLHELHLIEFRSNIEPRSQPPKIRFEG